MATADNAQEMDAKFPASISDLQDRLDKLWTQYLDHLDAYTKAQASIQQKLKSGFMSLSRANFNARPGMRYGRDYFHDRAVATRRAKASTGEAGNGGQVEIIKKTPSQLNDEDESNVEGEEDSQEPTQQPSPPATPAPEGEAVDEKPIEASPTSDTKKLPLEADPLRWYGILVPRELRAAQTSFAALTEEGLADAVNAGRGMRETETETRRVRKEIRRAEKSVQG